MEEVVKKDILNVLRQVVPALKSENVYQLNKLSNMTLHNASVFQDENSVAMGVLAYSLYKIYDRPRMKDQPVLEKLKKKILENLKVAQTNLQKNQLKGYNRAIKNILKDIGSFEKRFGLYVNEVLKQAKIKKGSRIYEHGMSVGKAASLLGISKWDLMSYIGGTKLNEKLKDVVSTEDRVELVRGLFNI